MIPKSAKRFSDKIMLAMQSMIPKSAKRFSDQIMLATQSMSTLNIEFSGAARLWG
jgi:hypothetical protein